MEPLYIAQPGRMRLLKAVLGLLIATDVVIAAVLLAFVNVASAAITFVAMLATLLVIWLILPRRYEVWPDRLRVVFPAWRWDIDFGEVATVRAAHWTEAYAFWGMRFATAPSQAVTVLRHKPNLFTRPNLVISRQTGMSSCGSYSGRCSRESSPFKTAGLIIAPGVSRPPPISPALLFSLHPRRPFHWLDLEPSRAVPTVFVPGPPSFLRHI